MTSAAIDEGIVGKNIEPSYQRYCYVEDQTLNSQSDNFPVKILVLDQHSRQGVVGKIVEKPL